MTTIDIDNDHWLPAFDRVIRPLFKHSCFEKALVSDQHYREDYLDAALNCADKFNVYHTASCWAAKCEFVCRHGTRLRDHEIESILKNGLTPLKEQNRLKDLERIVAASSATMAADGNIAKLRKSYIENVDRDSEAIFFSLSGENLKCRYSSQYLYYGSEFILVVLGESCGRRAKEIFRNETKPVIVSYLFKGEDIDGMYSESAVADFFDKGNRPQLAHLLLELWMLWCRNGDIQDLDPPIDYSHIHRGALPNGAKPHSIDTLDESQINPPDWRLGL